MFKKAIKTSPEDEAKIKAEQQERKENPIPKKKKITFLPYKIGAVVFFGLILIIALNSKKCIHQLVYPGNSTSGVYLIEWIKQEVAPESDYEAFNEAFIAQTAISQQITVNGLKTDQSFVDAYMDDINSEIEFNFKFCPQE